MSDATTPKAKKKKDNRCDCGRPSDLTGGGSGYSNAKACARCRELDRRREREARLEAAALRPAKHMRKREMEEGKRHPLRGYMAILRGCNEFFRERGMPATEI